MNPDAKVIAVGQNPGWEEVCQGIPFVGSSGKTMTAAFEALAGVKREDVYVTNTCHCFTVGNRKPTDEEVMNCRYFIEREFDIVRPVIAVALGSLAFKELTGMSGIMKHSGEIVFSVRYKVQVIAMLHPSPLNTNMPEKRKLFEDSIAKLKGFLDKEIQSV
jgi:DNA polymerase